jgi:hypothetical protein
MFGFITIVFDFVTVGMGSMTELHHYDHKLIGMKKTTQALKIFKTNAKAALPLAPNDLNKNSVSEMIKKLEKTLIKFFNY